MEDEKLFLDQLQAAIVNGDKDKVSSLAAERLAQLDVAVLDHLTSALDVVGDLSGTFSILNELVDFTDLSEKVDDLYDAISKAIDKRAKQAA